MRTDRITPAHAGKSRSTAREAIAGKDHPRTRGEKRNVRSRSGTTGGSPPHTRGKAAGRNFALRGIGITPAHAGKSKEDIVPATQEKDHPRTRGEKDGEIGGYPLAEGSPPHTRGKDTEFHIFRSAAGITPAHAGKSISGGIRPTLRQDHPRTRGEKP